jgi:21S rRNA (GM2251-2'-O)-methyltransferase
VDTGNLGAIIRSAYWFGIDAIALSSRGWLVIENRPLMQKLVLTAPSASLDAAGLRASSGAAEAVPLLTVENPDIFLSRSRACGWQVLAAMPPPDSTLPPIRGRTKSSLQPTSIPLYATARKPLILMLGGESKGIERHLIKHVNAFLTIRPYADTSAVGLDSLNVSVASALILSKVMRRPENKIISQLRGTFGTDNHLAALDSIGPGAGGALDTEGDFMMWNTK